MTGNRGWIGVDLDGTLAHYDTWRGPEHIGEPIMPMVERVRRWLAEGQEVRIMTARANLQLSVAAIQVWTHQMFGQVLEVTQTKDLHMKELWDDRAVQVIPNTGRTLAEEYEAERNALAGKP